jgi:hypothetical protein
MDLGEFARLIAMRCGDPKIQAAAKALLDELKLATDAKNDGGIYSNTFGLSIYAPQRLIDPKYLDNNAAWRDQTWTKFLASGLEVAAQSTGLHPQPE